MQARLADSAAGTYSGVAVVAKVPSRALCAAWPPDLFQTGRVQIVGSLLNNVWVTGAVMYGYPQGKIHHNALERTSDMLAFLVDHLTTVASGPRYLCGDWNFEAAQLPITQKLLQLGWKEVQDIQYHRTGLMPQCTCKRSTQKDVLWLSPELVASFVDLNIEHDRFPDHSVLKATFSLSSEHALRFLWPMPLPVPWPRVPDLEHPVAFDTAPPTQQYQKLWTSKESLAASALGDQWNPSMQGRGQRLAPTQRKGWTAPPKKGRSIDAQPMFHGYNVQHARWMKQLRRLQNYMRWAQHHYGHASSEEALHGLYLWKSILNAHGFGSSFQTWWRSRESIGLGDPGFVPDFPPPADVAQAIGDIFHSEVAILERKLSAAKKATRISQHQRDANLIYKDTKRTPPEPVTSLLITQRAVVTEIDDQDCAVDFEPPSCFDESKPVLVGHKAVPIIHATENRLYLEDLSSMQPETVLHQAQPLGSLPEIFAAFHEQWQQRWCRHDDIPHSRWQPLIDFARATMPRQPVDPLRLTPELVRAEAAAKKTHAATGLDGVSRLDVVQADDIMLRSICSMYTRAETTGEWPAQITTGRVASLAKKEGAATTNEFRPITIFSMLYRVYSSLHARMLLQWCDQWAHPDVHGNRKAHSTTHLWRTIVADIQVAYDQSRTLSGLTADIEKCFNCLPRWPILAIALHAGAPASVLCAWAGALASMTRRFKVRDSYSEGFLTSTGLAEGCALSCFGMLLLDDLLHRYIQMQYPAIRVLSFVDNWDFLTWDPTVAERQLDALLDFAQLTDLTVDRKKTFGWSTSAEVRAAMRASGLPVLHYARDLGAHIGFSRQRTNRTVMDRLEGLQPFWQQLKQSRAGFKSKLRALRTVAWPRGLYAIESAPVSFSTWTTQRRQAVQALHFDKAGINPLLLLGLVEAYVDPEFVAVLRTVSEARLHSPLDFWAGELFPLASGFVESPPTSLATILLDRVHKLGIVIHPDGQCEDQIGKFHPGLVNHTEMCHRLHWQWNQYVASLTAYRKDFAGLNMVDATATRQCLAKLAPDDQAYLRVSLAGGLFTQDAHKHWNDQAGHCKWCGQAHKRLHQATSQHDAWMIWHNNQVDAVAKRANLARSQEFWKCWQVHVDAVQTAAVLHRQVCELHLAVAKRSTQADREQTLDDVAPPVQRPTRTFPMKFDKGEWTGEMPLAFANEYGAGLAQRIVQWWLARTSGTSVGPVRWITFAHLYVDYQLAWGCPGPVKSGKRWLDPSTRPYLDPERHPFLHRLKWFKRCLKVLWKHTHQTEGLAFCRGEGDSIQSFVATASLQWCTASWAGAELWLSQELEKPCLRGTDSLKALPLAKAQGRYAISREAGRMSAKYSAVAERISEALPTIKKMEQMAAARAVWVHQPLPVTEPQELVSLTVAPPLAEPAQ
ncbi:unnamed protein product [Cladocopium goreaui]|uniref:Reverse transcriptase domain-containing protein n=1 Tax=Cladocopium goreaui TaxID=2562237 RepID=A0A9P1CLQ9_9DINO|nr:unnamed protein product [Cladocopium goreaui]